MSCPNFWSQCDENETHEALLQQMRDGNVGHVVLAISEMRARYAALATLYITQRLQSDTTALHRLWVNLEKLPR